MKPIREYVDANGITVKVYPEKKTKRRMWMKNDTFYSAKMRIDDDSCFASFSRKPGKA